MIKHSPFIKIQRPSRSKAKICGKSEISDFVDAPTPRWLGFSQSARTKRSQTSTAKDGRNIPANEKAHHFCTAHRPCSFLLPLSILSQNTFLSRYFWQRKNPASAGFNHMLVAGIEPATSSLPWMRSAYWAKPAIPSNCTISFGFVKHFFFRKENFLPSQSLLKVL